MFIINHMVFSVKAIWLGQQNVERIKSIYCSQLTSWYQQILRHIIYMCIHYFSFVMLVSFFFVSFQSLQSAWTAYDKHSFCHYVKKPWHYKSHSLLSIALSIEAYGSSYGLVYLKMHKQSFDSSISRYAIQLALDVFFSPDGQKSPCCCRIPTNHLPRAWTNQSRGWEGCESYDRFSQGTLSSANYLARWIAVKLFSAVQCGLRYR